MLIDRERIKLNERELRQRLKGPVSAQAERAVSAVKEIMEPACLVRESGIGREGDSLRLGFGDIHSGNLMRNLEGCRRAYIIVATLGHRVDMAIRRAADTDISFEYFLDAAASAMIESVIDYIEDSLPVKTRPRFAPGYGDFSIEAQRPLLEYMRADRIGVGLTSSGLMVPQKSISCIMGVIDEDNG